MRLGGLSFALILLMFAPVEAQDWSMYLRDLSHSSFDSSEPRLDPKILSTMQPAWTLSVGAVLAAGVTISNGVLYFGDWNGNFHAVDALTGQALWKTFVGKAANPSDSTCLQGIGVSSQATVIGNSVYVGGGDSAVYALDKSSGNQLWRVSLADPALGAYLWSSIVPYQNGLYVGVASLDDCPIVRGALARIDLQNPQQPLIQYLASADRLGAGIWSTVAIDPAANTIFVTTGNGDSQDAASGNYSDAFLSMNASTLAVQSSFLLPPDESIVDFDWGSSATLFSTPDGVRFAAATAKDGVLYAVLRDSMTLAWKTKLAAGCVDPEQGCGSISTPAFDGNTLFVGGGVRDVNGFANGSVYAIRPADGSVIWERDTDGTVLAPVTVANGLVFVPTDQGLEIYHSATGQFLWSDGKRGALYSQAVVSNGMIFSTYVKGEVVAWQLPAIVPNTLFNYSAATGLQSLAPGAITSAYGTNLNGASMVVADSTGASNPVEILNSSSGLINYVLPYSLAPGRATVTMTGPGGNAISAPVQISAVSPGIFSANADGKGVAAAQVIRVSADGTQNVIPVFQCGAAPGSCVPGPVDLGTSSDQAYLVLYGTGIRGLTSLQNVTCTIGGVSAPVVYAGMQNTIDGLDQVNVLLPKTLAGRGQVDVILSVDRQLANTVTISIQ
jgi:uncharacterized protein (TIGR03437 family)